jgi:tripartite-type tricarboxylate transporter receptor subunit TctC
MNRKLFLKLLATFAGSTNAPVSWAQKVDVREKRSRPEATRTVASAPQPPGYPSKLVRLVVPFAPGGGADVVARLLAQRMGENLKQSFIVDNRSGAGGTIGTDAVAKSVPDGYTLLLAPSSHVVNPAIYSRLPYNTEKDFAPIGLVAGATILLACNASVPVSNFKEFVDLVRQPRSKYANYGSAGTGTVFHLITEQLKKAAGLNLQHIPYRGGAPATGAIVRGEVSALFETAITLTPFVKQGLLRPLVVTSKVRSPLFPDVPTVGEIGMPQLIASNDYALYAPAGTPEPIIRFLNAQMRQAMNATDIKARLYVQGTTVYGSSPEELRHYVDQEIKRWTVVAADSDIRAE